MRKMVGTIFKREGNYFVGAKDTESEYIGPTAQVYSDYKTWFSVDTDSYEGCAMMHIETLPVLLKALKLLQKDIKTARGNENDQAS